jgi:DNA invertase Pin-like site-specific DNA recombinase
MKVAVYTRVSTLDQQKGAKSQTWAIRRYLESHGLKAKWFNDSMSGADINRPAFAKLQKAIFNGQVDTVIVWKLDRISRSLADGVRILTDWLAKDVRIIAVAQQLDFSGSVGQLVASVLFAIAQMERENLRENTKRGLAAAKARGVKLGGRVPGKWTAEVLPLHEQGLSCSQIAAKLNRSRQAVHNVLTGKTATYSAS